jgi:hypothetical protein
MILAAESHGEHGEAKHDVAADGAEAYDVVEDHNEVATQGATTLLLLLLPLTLIMNTRTWRC